MDRHEAKLREELTSLFNSFYPDVFTVRIVEAVTYSYYVVSDCNGNDVFSHGTGLEIVKWMNRNCENEMYI